MAIKLKPTVAAIGVVCVFLFAYFRPIQLPSPVPQRVRPDFEFKSVVIEEYSGDQLKLVLAANRAVLDRDSGYVDMHRVSGNALIDKHLLTVHAPTARYDQSNHVLYLDDGRFLMNQSVTAVQLNATEFRWDVARHVVSGRKGVSVRSNRFVASGPSFDFNMNTGKLKLIGRSNIKVNE